LFPWVLSPKYIRRNAWKISQNRSQAYRLTTCTLSKFHKSKSFRRKKMRGRQKTLERQELISIKKRRKIFFIHKIKYRKSKSRHYFVIISVQTSTHEHKIRWMCLFQCIKWRKMRQPLLLLLSDLVFNGLIMWNNCGCLVRWDIRYIFPSNEGKRAQVFHNFSHASRGKTTFFLRSELRLASNAAKKI
jgi:hypothetical protein